MQTILVVGAGKTSVYLIEYLLNHSHKNNWNVIVADNDITAIYDKIGNHSKAEAEVLDITNNEAREELVAKSDIVVSLMPPHLHILLAKDCLKHKKHLITSSYVSPEMQQLDNEAKEAGLMFMCEMGLDPGIDHMTSCKMIDSIHKVAGKITSFKSYAGGLIAPECDNNPWHYKFTWNPRNIVLAGQMGARHLVNGKKQELSYKEVFASPKRYGSVKGAGMMYYYPNRDTLNYLEKYDLPDVKTFLRATFRYPDFISGWNTLIQLGLTTPDDTIQSNTYAGWIAEKNGLDTTQNIKAQATDLLNIAPDSKIANMLTWLGIFEDLPIPTKKRSSADILLDLLLGKWSMHPEDKDMIVMVHEVEYEHRNNNKTKLTGTMILKGEDGKHSAMAKTVGMPMAILTKMILTGKIAPIAGVHIPRMQAVYKPVLAELEEHGIEFTEEVS